MRGIFKFLGRMIIVASVVSAVLGIIYYFNDRKNDYIEIYNDDYDEFDDGYDLEETIML